MQPLLNKTLLSLAFTLTLITSPVLARDGVTVPLPDKSFAVISEGDNEGRSMGSYSVAIYKDKYLNQFLTGAIFSRNGSVFQDDGKVRLDFADITGDGKQELIVSKLTAGSGNYLEVDALNIQKNTIKLISRVQTDTKSDKIAALKAAYRAAHKKKK